jgi:hypothetical protein
VGISPAQRSKMCSFGHVTAPSTLHPQHQVHVGLRCVRWRWKRRGEPARTSRGVLSRRPARSGLTNSLTALCSPSSLRASTCVPNSTLVQLVEQVAPSVGLYNARPDRILRVRHTPQQRVQVRL